MNKISTFEDFHPWAQKTLNRNNTTGFICNFCKNEKTLCIVLEKSDPSLYYLLCSEECLNFLILNQCTG